MGFLRSLFEETDTSNADNKPVLWWRVKGALPGGHVHQSTLLDERGGMVLLRSAIGPPRWYVRSELDFFDPTGDPGEDDEPTSDRETEALAYEKGVADTVKIVSDMSSHEDFLPVARRVQFELLRTAMAERRRMFGVFGTPPGEANA